MPKRSEQNVALVTGASTGIGYATALRLKSAGYLVYAAARRVEKMAALRDVGINVLKMDVTQDADLVAGVEQILQDCDRLDVLVNNAGYGSYGALEDVPLSEGKYQFEVNLFGLARLTQLVLPTMRRQGDGYIVNLSSIGGKIYEPCGSWYHATKFAVEGMSDCLRLELQEFGIKVVIIEPGATASEWSQIARENLLKASGETAYRNVAARSHRFLALAENLESPADSAAVQILKAVQSKHPKARYTSGRGTGMIAFLRKVLSDELIDALMLAALR